ncbi:MAG: putative motility protein [Fibrobacteria bacterium]
MSGIAGVSGVQSGGSAQDLIMLKKTQDLMKQQSSQLLAALPQPAAPPGPPGVGGKIDLQA